MTTFLLDGRSLYISGKLRQISADDTVFCPVCHEEMLYWQLPWSSCYEGKTIKIKEAKR